jgi:hypothetical protein
MEGCGLDVGKEGLLSLIKGNLVAMFVYSTNLARSMASVRDEDLRIVTARFFARFILLFIYVYFMCSYVINCLCVYFWLGA